VNSPFKKILVYIDGSEASISAMRFAIYMAKFSSAELTALYVINTKAMEDLVRARIFIHEEKIEYAQDLEANAIRYINHAQELAHSKGLVIQTQIVHGNPHHEIEREIKDGNFDLLILGEVTRIISRRHELLNDAERAMRTVNCSVLIIKNEERVSQLFDMLH
jgi:nucleotide-binding universal stress UspA family protein